MICTEMCGDCPVLQEKLHGHIEKAHAEGNEEASTGLYCSTCHTSLNAVKMGQPIGCSECYAVFGDFLINELIEANLLPPQLQKTLPAKKTQPLHMGKTPISSAPLAISSRLKELSDALNEAVKKENYEHAAWLRDQIKILKEKRS